MFEQSVVSLHEGIRGGDPMSIAGELHLRLGEMCCRDIRLHVRNIAPLSMDWIERRAIVVEEVCLRRREESLNALQHHLECALLREVVLSVFGSMLLAPMSLWKLQLRRDDVETTQEHVGDVENDDEYHPLFFNPFDS